MKVAGLLLLVLALSWAPRPPTRGLKAFLERLNLSNYIDAFERQGLELRHVRRMTEEQLERVGVDLMGTGLDIVQAASELTDEELQPVEEEPEPEGEEEEEEAPTQGNAEERADEQGEANDEQEEENVEETRGTGRA